MQANGVTSSTGEQLEDRHHHSKRVGRSSMPSSLVDQIDTPEATIASFRDPAREETLVVAAKNGNEQAFEILVKRHEQRILAVAQRYTHAQEDAKDVVQQTFQNAFVHLHSFELKSSFSTWLTRIAINEALMLLRRRRRLHEVHVGESSEREGNSWYPEMPDSSSDPEANYARRERVRILTAALGNLRPGLRRAVELRDLGELSTSETARCMDLSVAAVKARLFHARRELRQALTRYLKFVRMPRNDISAGDPKSIPRDRLSCLAKGDAG
jgi:RNA polymerase sigma-70 factor, ECF subfamily